MKTSFSETDLQDLKTRGISPEVVQEQFDRFDKGFPFLKIADTATLDNGIMKLDPLSVNNAVLRWKRYIEGEGDCMKFVPASGAASRMFKSVHKFVNGDTDIPAPGSEIDELLLNIRKLPFYNDLDAACRRMHGEGAEMLSASGRNRDLLKALIAPEGLNYGNMPKGLLLFHSYPFGNRTPVEEQLIEAAKYANCNGLARLHFTVSAAHEEMFCDVVSRVAGPLQELTDTRFDITFSVQKPSTDTPAANLDNTPHRENGHLFFRPGGHGSLIENLNDIEASVVFIKNIDNVVNESRLADTIQYKMVLGGILLQVRDVIHKYLNKLGRGHNNPELLDEIKQFMRSILFIEDIRMDTLKGYELAEFLAAKLDRPIRVCGMVRNLGEPGGGPFLVYGNDHSIQPQILESSQIDPDNARYAQLLKTSTHFNPVDIVCYLRNANGKKFNLHDYVDPETGFITNKSVHGAEIKAMERPGLWNGAMSDWNTVFVEVPVSTFNPVKTVNDLLRPTHNCR